MASTTFCVETVKKSLEADGFSDLQDSTVGDRILDMELRRFPFATVYGLEFCSFVIFHERIRSVLEASFGNCSLGHSMRYKKKPGRIFCYISSLELARHLRTIPGGPEVGYPLMVHLWAKGSQVDYYIGSHKHELPILEDESSSKEPLFEIPRSALVKAGCEPKSFTFEHGGVIIADARIAFELKEGYVITDVFFPDRLLPRQKMILPYSGELTAKVDEIKKASGRIGLNFGFKDMPRSTND